MPRVYLSNYHTSIGVMLMAPVVTTRSDIWSLIVIRINNLLLIGQFFLSHEDVIKWKHFPRYWPLCVWNSPVTGEFPSQRPVTRSFDVFFERGLDKHRVNNPDAGDLRRHRAHNNVTVMNVGYTALYAILVVFFWTALIQIWLPFLYITYITGLCTYRPSTVVAMIYSFYVTDNFRTQ